MARMEYNLRLIVDNEKVSIGFIQGLYASSGNGFEWKDVSPLVRGRIINKLKAAAEIKDKLVK